MVELDDYMGMLAVKPVMSAPDDENARLIGGRGVAYRYPILTVAINIDAGTQEGLDVLIPLAVLAAALQVIDKTLYKAGKSGARSRRLGSMRADHPAAEERQLSQNTLTGSPYHWKIRKKT